VRYDQVTRCCSNEFLKEHKAFVEEHGTVQEQERLLRGLQKQIETAHRGTTESERTALAE